MEFAFHHVEKYENRRCYVCECTLWCVMWIVSIYAETFSLLDCKLNGNTFYCRFPRVCAFLRDGGSGIGGLLYINVMNAYYISKLANVSSFIRYFARVLQ